MMNDIINALEDMKSEGRPYAIATVIETTGSVSAAIGAKAVIDAHGMIIAGWVGGGCAESMTQQTAVETFADGRPRIITLDMNDEVLGTGMPCGGSMRVFVEPIIPAPQLWILGHGRIAECLCEMAAFMAFRVIIIDPSADPRRYPSAEQLICDDWTYEKLKPNLDDFVVIATQHKGDHQSMKQALATSVRYIALIASRKRAGLVMNYLREEGFRDSDLTRVYAPAGLDLGARSAEGIALSVISEIVSRRHDGSGTPLRKPGKSDNVSLLPSPKDRNSSHA